jgi:hypothetical protein
MSNTNTGGPAFPAGHVRMSRPIHDPGANWVETDRVQPLHKGLDLRDYFAAKAMRGLMDAAMPMPEIADEAYAMADAMLRAREQ